jgi:hypothetical protein
MVMIFLGIAVALILVFSNAYSFFEAERVQKRIYQRTASDTNFNRYQRR